MPSIPVTGYEAAWNPQSNAGDFKISLAGGPLQNVALKSPEEFLALLIMLGRENVQFDPQIKWVFLPLRSPGA